MQSIRRAAYLAVTVIGGGIILFFFFKYLFGLILPFLIAWAVAFLTATPAAWLHEKCRLPLSLLRTVVSVVIVLGLLFAFGAIIYLLGYELVLLLGSLGEGDTVGSILDLFGTGAIGDALAALGDTVGDVFRDLFVSLATAIGGKLSGIVTAVPAILFFVLITVIATIYFSLDLDRVNRAVARILPRKIYDVAVRFKREVFTVAGGYIRSYLCLMLITFVIILAGLVILRRPYALLLAVVIAILDLLPVIGVGTILIPWGAFEIFIGDRAVGIGLLVLFALHELIRQLVEPRLVSHHLGVHPIITLMLIYIGCSLFGFVGILLVPLVSVLINLFVRKVDTAEVDELTVTKKDG